MSLITVFILLILSSVYAIHVWKFFLLLSDSDVAQVLTLEGIRSSQGLNRCVAIDTRLAAAVAPAFLFKYGLALKPSLYLSVCIGL